MMMKITMSLAALALGGGLTIGSAFAQHTGARSPDDNGVPSTGQSGQSTQPSQSSGPYDQSGGMYNQAPGMGAPDPSSGMYNAAPGMGAQGDQNAAASCEMRFRSYDPASGTYVGFDGVRHPCP
jgi:hypothetical protein